MQVISVRKSNEGVTGIVLDILVIFKPLLTSQIIPNTREFDTHIKDAIKHRYFGSLVACLPEYGACEPCAMTITGKSFVKEFSNLKSCKKGPINFFDGFEHFSINLPLALSLAFFSIVSC